MSSSPSEALGRRRFVLVASLVGAAGGGYWLGLVVLVLLTPERSILDLVAGIVAFALLCALKLSFQTWGPGQLWARLLLAFAAVLGVVGTAFL